MKYLNQWYCWVGKLDSLPFVSKRDHGEQGTMREKIISLFPFDGKYKSQLGFRYVLAEIEMDECDWSLFYLLCFSELRIWPVELPMGPFLCMVFCLDVRLSDDCANFWSQYIIILFLGTNSGYPQANGRVP